VMKNDVVHLHLPQFDAAGIALRGRLLKKPTVLTYHCDLKMPPGLFNKTANYAIHVMNHLAAFSSHRIVTYTQDYASNSPYTKRYFRKVHTILPPVELPSASQASIDQFFRDNELEGRGPVIGMAARFAAEKGVEVLLGALPRVLDAHSNAVVLYAGQYQDVLGEEDYARRLFPIIEKYRQRGQWKFLGVLEPSQMAAFYPSLDVLVIPSLNSTESFGLVQIEAMMNGVPVVASNLPGVRQPAAITGMGTAFPVGDANGLADSLLCVLGNPEEFRGDPEQVRQQFSPADTAAAYEALFTEIKSEIQVRLR
ncbi:MAG TPA: glycosyltransferase family 4 protein, partial [Anaerolineales bacterium]